MKATLNRKRQYQSEEHSGVQDIHGRTDADGVILDFGETQITVNGVESWHITTEEDA